MSKVLDDAVSKVKALSEDRQRYADEVLEHIATACDGGYQLSEDERRLVRRMSRSSSA